MEGAAPMVPAGGGAGQGEWSQEEHYRFLKALQQYEDDRKTMPAAEWLQKISEAVDTRSVEETRGHIQAYFQATNHESLLPSSLMALHDQQHSRQAIQIVHPNCIIACDQPLAIQQPPRLNPRAFTKIKAHQTSLLAGYCSGACWTREEQIVLEEGLKRFPATHCNNLTRYVKIAAFLPDKTITDVAQRYKWMVELQRLNSVNYSGSAARADGDGAMVGGEGSSSSSSAAQQLGRAADGSGVPESPSQSDTAGMAPPPTSYVPMHFQEHDRSGAAVGAAPGIRRRDAAAPPVTTEAGAAQLMDENDELIARMNRELGAAAGCVQADGTLDKGMMGSMIQLRSNLANVLNCMALSSGTMSKLPPLLVKLHPLPFGDTPNGRTPGALPALAGAVPVEGSIDVTVPTPMAAE